MAISILVAAPPRLVVGGVAREQRQGERDGEGDFRGVERPEDQPADAEPERHGDAGPRNFNGVSRNEIASTMTGHTNGTAYRGAGVRSWLPADARRRCSLPAVSRRLGRGDLGEAQVGLDERLQAHSRGWGINVGQSPPE